MANHVRISLLSDSPLPYRKGSSPEEWQQEKVKWVSDL